MDKGGIGWREEEEVEEVRRSHRRRRKRCHLRRIPGKESQRTRNKRRRHLHRSYRK